MTEERVLAGNPDAVRIEGSREEFVVYDQPAEIMYYGAPQTSLGLADRGRACFITLATLRAARAKCLSKERRNNTKSLKLATSG